MTRVASFLASATEIVCALGAHHDVVGISHECDHPPSIAGKRRLSRPRFPTEGLTSGEIDAALRRAMQLHGSAYSIDEEALAEARPDVVFTQAVCDVCAVPAAGVEDAIARLGLASSVVSLDAHSVSEILASFGQVAAAIDRVAAGAELLEEVESRLAAVTAAVAGEPAPSVLCLEWLDPPFTPGHWVPEMVQLAGGTMSGGRAGGPSSQIQPEDLAGLDPDILIVMPCGYDLEQSVADAEANVRLLRLAGPRAIAAGRAFAVDGSAYFNRSGPRFVRGVEILAGLLHPRRYPAPAGGEARPINLG